jgi:hypothetical protein
MNEEWPGSEPGDAAEEPNLAERLIREEFSEGAHAHRTWFHRDDKAATSGTGEVAHPDDPPAESDERADDELVGSHHETAEVAVVGATALAGSVVIHEEFSPPSRTPRFRSHRAGMLAGLGVVGALLAVLVVLSPGGGTPRLPAQSVHDVSPITASGPRTAAATTPTTAAATTTSAPATTTTTRPHQTETITTTITYVYLPGQTTAAPTPTTTPPPDTTTTAPPPTTTTTTVPPTTTTTTHCFLGLIC